MAPHRVRSPVCTVAALLLVTACGACRDEPADDVGDAGCTFASCDRECRSVGLCYGSCGGGMCNCSDYGCSDDVGLDEADCLPDVDEDREAPRPDVFDGEDAGTTCDLFSGLGTREGSSPGVRCCPVPTAGGYAFSPAEGLGSLILYSGTVALDLAEPIRLRWYDWVAGEQGVFEDLVDLPCELYRSADYPSADGPWLAYSVTCGRDPGGLTEHNELRLLNRDTGHRRVLARNQGAAGEPVTMRYVSLDYPWVVWREVGEEFSYAWMAYAVDVETLERRQLVDLSLAGVHTVGVLDGVALVDNGAVTLTDLATGESRQVVGHSCDDDPPAPRCDGRWGGVITPDWVAWLDSRHRPECGWFRPCSTKIYGWNRRTETEQPLVISPGMHGPRLTGRGDWLVYDDQRDDADPEYDSDRQQNIYGLHLPTMTEIRIEDWPGFQYEPAVYSGTDGWHVLFFEEGGGRTATLWDCTLPEL